jgi:hypothetical protein
MRFDGARFVEWTPPGGAPFPGRPPSQLLASNDGSLWIGGDGVAQLRGDGVWRRLNELDALRRVRLAEEKDGTIWVGAESSPTPHSFSLFHIDHGQVGAYQLPSSSAWVLLPCSRTGKEGFGRIAQAASGESFQGRRSWF